MMTLPPLYGECLEIWSLNRPEPSRPHGPVMGIVSFLYDCFDFEVEITVQKLKGCKLPDVDWIPA